MTRCVYITDILYVDFEMSPGRITGYTAYAVFIPPFWSRSFNRLSKILMNQGSGTSKRRRGEATEADTVELTHKQ